MIKSQVAFRLGNRRVSQRDFMKGIERQVAEKAKEAILRKARSVIDPATGRPARVRVARDNPLEFVVEGSKEAIARVKAKLR